jgi:hypothetical protein
MLTAIATAKTALSTSGLAKITLRWSLSHGAAAALRPGSVSKHTAPSLHDLEGCLLGLLQFGHSED